MTSAIEFEQLLFDHDFIGVSEKPKKGRLKPYSDVLTAEVNRKGVLDVDTVKGCTEGMKKRKGTGCYNACYAANIARFRGMDFSRSIIRRVHSSAHALRIEAVVKNSPCGFFRVGTMGDPCHAWEHTVVIIEWLAPFAVPVVITKHWIEASDQQLVRLINCGTILNTSISALDTDEELERREQQIARYQELGGVSISRVVSCEFNEATEEGKRMALVQERLVRRINILDNPLRASKSHRLHKSGIIKLDTATDLNSERTISLHNKETYLGHCSKCPDQCGLSSRNEGHPKPQENQLKLL